MWDLWRGLYMDNIMMLCDECIIIMKMVVMMTCDDS